MKPSGWRKSFVGLAICLLSTCIDTTGQATITYYPPPPGYTNYQLRFRNVVRVHPNGNAWVGFRKVGVGIFDGSSWTMYDSLNSSLPANNVLSLAFIGNDAWIGTTNGLAKFDGVTWTVFDTANSGLLRNKVVRLFADGTDLWIAFESGLQHFDGISWTTFTQSSGLANDTV